MKVKRNNNVGNQNNDNNYDTQKGCIFNTCFPTQKFPVGYSYCTMSVNRNKTRKIAK